MLEGGVIDVRTDGWVDGWRHMKTDAHMLRQSAQMGRQTDRGHTNKHANCENDSRVTLLQQQTVCV